MPSADEVKAALAAIRELRNALYDAAAHHWSVGRADDLTPQQLLTLVGACSDAIVSVFVRCGPMERLTIRAMAREMMRLIENAEAPPDGGEAQN
jgi:hypothetical protein